MNLAWCYILVICLKNYYDIYFVGMESGCSSHVAGNKIRSRQAWTKDEEETMLNILDAMVELELQIY